MIKMIFLRWILKTIQWFYTEFRLSWLCLTVVAASFCVVAINDAVEPMIRITGMFLQIGGICTVAWGIRETRKLFDHPSLIGLVKESFERFPKFRPQQRSFVMRAAINATTNIEGRAVSSLPPNSSLELRVAAIEGQLVNLTENINKVQTQLVQETQKMSSELKKERINRENEDQTIHNRLEVAETGGLRISIVGLIWLFLGVIMSSASLEIAKFMN